jgi:hypothetical protein
MEATGHNVAAHLELKMPQGKLSERQYLQAVAWYMLAQLNDEYLREASTRISDCFESWSMKQSFIPKFVGAQRHPVKEVVINRVPLTIED